jgi:uroporphyrinogen III methyltransferase/synthase
MEMFKDKHIKALLKKVKLASIGPITSQTIKEYGLKPQIEADKFTIEGLVEKIIEDNLNNRKTLRN